MGEVSEMCFHNLIDFNIFFASKFTLTYDLLFIKTVKCKSLNIFLENFDTSYPSVFLDLRYDGRKLVIITTAIRFCIVWRE